MKDFRGSELDASPEGVPQPDPEPLQRPEVHEIRLLRGPEEYAACVDLQRGTWGEEFEGHVPALLLELHQKTGGLVAGAFDEGELVGFVFGFPAREDGLPYHWSHMLAVREDSRGQGIGRRLKLFQRERLLGRGTTVACWSFDPLVARNAHLNLNRLGAEILGYVPDMYGDTDSPLHGELGTDRLLTFWELGGDRAREAIAEDRRVDFTPFARAPEVGYPEEVDEEVGHDASTPGANPSPDGAFPEAERVRIEIPPGLERLREERPELLAAWRDRVGAAFDHYLGRDYGVVALWRPPGTDRSAYCLEGPEATRRTGP